MGGLGPMREEKKDNTNRALKPFTLNLPKEAIENIDLFIKWGWYVSKSEFGRKAIEGLIAKEIDFFEKSGALKTAFIDDDKIITIPGHKNLYLKKVLK